MPRNVLAEKLEAQGQEPLYKQVEKRILQCLAAGEWRPGDRIPTEPQLAERFGVAVFTIRAGISELVAAGILVRRQGKGTFVARHGRQLRYQFTHVFTDAGARVAPERELISIGRAAATDEVTGFLELAPSRRGVIAIECRLHFESRPIALMDIWLPPHLFSGLTARAIRDSDENLYSVYQDCCGINVIRIEERVHAVKAGARAARALRLDAAEPVLCIDRVDYTYNDLPVEFRRRVHIASGFHYQIGES